MKKTYRCDLCDKEVDVKGGELVDAKCLVWRNELTQEEYTKVRCNECYKSRKGLSFFQPCEVYSRVVGYLRPVRQWNIGKQQEYKERKNFKYGNTTKKQEKESEKG